MSKKAPRAQEEESPKDRITRLVSERRITREAVEQAEAFWRDRLRHGVRMPKREMVHVTLDDLYHVIVDPRIWRHPYRIEVAIANIFEIRVARQERRLALSRWREDDQQRLAAVILGSDNTLKAIHLIDEVRLRRYTKQEGDVLWKH
ncbi:MAG: hypothetical protein HY675_13070 [Chloroflexi bacterium]|nr:hypothetical protein [Chloroflexota bacterium]